MQDKNFKIKPEQIKEIIKDNRGCVVSHKIIVEGMKVGYMYREPYDEDIENDSGWRFLSGTETDDYLDSIENSEILPLNTVANYDPAIVSYLKNSIGIELERVEGLDKFRKIDE